MGIEQSLNDRLKELISINSYGVKKNFKSSKTYYMYTFGQDLVQVHYNRWGENVDDKALHKALRQELAKEKWDPKNADTVQSYRNLFNKLGTHIVTGAKYGNRLSLVGSAPTAAERSS